jgi:hypothetical protein
MKNKPLKRPPGQLPAIKRRGQFAKPLTTKGTKRHEGTPKTEAFVILRGSWFLCLQPILNLR